MPWWGAQILGQVRLRLDLCGQVDSLPQHLHL